MAVRYRLVFRGKLLPGMGPEQVAQNLVALFGVTLETAQAMLASAPAVIRPDVDVEQGNRMLEALANAGLISHLEPATTAAGEELPLGWDGVERRRGLARRTGEERRGGSRDASLRPDRRQSRGRRKTD